MRIPERLEPLVDIGVVQEVVRPLMSGKEAAVYLVVSEGELRVAKVYKEAIERSFQNRADYTEGRKVRNSRDMRAMAKRTRFGKEAIESAWRTAEVDAIYKLRAAGVRVPEPYAYEEGVLIMELIRGSDGHPAPRLVDLRLSEEEAVALMDRLLAETIKMVCAGVVHGDLSDFNVLIEPDGPVIIDLPQWVDPASNRNARRLLVRDVDNLTSFLGRFAPELNQYRFGPEMWDLYESGQLRPGVTLTGRWRPRQSRQADVGGVLGEIQAAVREARPSKGSVKVSSFFEGLSWPDAAASKKGPAARARNAPPEPPPEPPRPPSRSGQGSGASPQRGPSPGSNAGPPRGPSGGASAGPQRGPPPGANAGPARGPAPPRPEGEGSGAPRRRRRRRRGPGGPGGPSED